MREKRNLIITNVSIKRIMVHIEGENTNPDLHIKQLLLRDYMTNDRLVPTNIKWQDQHFSLSFNLMSLNNEEPMHTGDWYLIGIDQKGRMHEVYPLPDLCEAMKVRTFNISNDYNAYFIKSNNNKFVAESKIDEDNASYYLKIQYNIPHPPLSSFQKWKRNMHKRKTALRQGAYVKVFNFWKHFNKEDGNRILFTSSSRSEIGGNEKFVYDRMVERGVDKQFHIDFSYKESIKSYRSPLSKFSFARKLAMANIILCDDYQPELYLVDYLPHVQIIQLWHACGAFKTVGLERLGKPGAPAFNTRIHKCYTAMTVSSQLAADHYAEAFGIHESKILPLGVPRTDIFFSEEYRKAIIPQVEAAFPMVKDAKEVIMYAPTFRGVNAKNASFPMDMIDFDAWGEYLHESHSVMLIKMHPFVKEPLNIPEQYRDVIVDASAYREINNMLFVTDLLITDYSSVIYEFSLFHKPMLFYAFDRMKYEADRGFYEPYSEMVPGKIVRTSEELLHAIRKRDFEFEKVDPFVKKNFKFTDGKATDRIIDTLILKK